jgi:hypothetical protein
MVARNVRNGQSLESFLPEGALAGSVERLPDRSGRESKAKARICPLSSITKYVAVHNTFAAGEPDRRNVLKANDTLIAQSRTGH